MKRLSIVLCALCATLYWTVMSYADITFSWTPYVDESGNADILRIYRSSNSLTCDEVLGEPPSDTVPPYTITDQMALDNGVILPVENGFKFFVQTAVDTDPAEEEESGYSNELIQKYCNYETCNANFTVSVVNGDDVLYTFEEIPGVSSNRQIRYSKEGESTYESVEVTSSPGYINDLEAGVYDFDIYAYDAENRLILMNNVYPTFGGLEIAGGPPPDPVFSYDSQGFGDTHTLMIGFPQDPDMAIDHFRVNLYSSSALRTASIDSQTGKTGIETADLVYDEVVARNTNYCVDINTSDNHMVFIKIESVSSLGVVSNPVFAERLFGNIVGTVIEGTPFESTVINTDDRNALVTYGYNLYRVNPYVPTSYDYCYDSNLYEKLPLPVHEGSDFNQDYYISATDLLYLYRTLMNRTGAGK